MKPCDGIAPAGIDMRASILLLAVLSTLATPLAAAHLTHGGCSSRTVLGNNVVHVDSYNRPCSGAVAYSPIAQCAGADLHFIVGVHVLVLYDGGCQTGVVLEPITFEGDAPLLP